MLAQGRDRAQVDRILFTMVVNPYLGNCQVAISKVGLSFSVESCIIFILLYNLWEQHLTHYIDQYSLLSCEMYTLAVHSLLFIKTLESIRLPTSCNY